ncbi:putative membrane protein [Myroides marinus]|uniref:Putative membrane protein n=1 Tax=Myroides marinus TaxID=703342 RepID=A0A1H6U6J5_9FLAO|nr:PH domain-containing protein [Myroides marinus]SEI83532.1 putative membrane protein [Myroides marinus]
MRQSNFYRPTRQAQIGIIANFLNALQKVVRAFVPLLIVFFVNKRIELSTSIWAFVIIGAFLSLGIAYLSYRNFLFYIDEQTNSFIIQQGIINKSKVTIQLEKIQQVNLNQSFINKLINVYSVEIDSAGSKDKEATIPSMALADANVLKQILLDYKSENQSIHYTNLSESNISTEYHPIETKRISVSTLLKVGLTTNYLYTLGVILLFFNMLYDTLVNKFAIEQYVNTDEVTSYVERGVPTLIIIYLVVLLIVAILVVNVVRTFLKFWDFKAILSRETLLLSHGLLSTRNTIIRPERVQKIEVEQNYFQKLLDICSLKISQVAGEDTTNKKTGLQIPGCSAVEKEELFNILVGSAGGDYSTELKHNYRFLGFRIFLLIVLPASLFTCFFKTEFTITVYSYLIFTYCFVVGLVLYRLYRVGRLYVSDSFIVIRKGVWDVSHIYIQPHKIQKIVVSQLWWQQSADVGSLQIYTAGGIISFSTTRYSELVQLRDKWLYQVESTALNWM